MNVDVTIDGKPWKIAVDSMPDGNRYDVTVKGRRRVIDAMWVDADTLSVVDGETREVYEIGLIRGVNGTLDVRVGGTWHRAIVEKQRRLPGSPRAEQTGNGLLRDGRIVAPMPGRVVRVLVAVGDRVTARQPVVVVEAMKMENELRAPHDGVVREVNVKEGTAIEGGAVLLEIG